MEAVFGKINFPREYYLRSTRPYCPPVLSSLFFKAYKLGTKSFLSKKARIPGAILKKNKEHLLAVLIAFIIDEGYVDSTMIGVSIKNKKLGKDLFEICRALGYETTLTERGEYATVSILREGMTRFFSDYKKLVQRYPEVALGKIESKIEDSFKIFNRPIYKTKGNKGIILQMIKNEDLTVNEIAQRVNMTRQGVRFHIHGLERAKLIFRKGYIGERNIIYCYKG